MFHYWTRLHKENATILRATNRTMAWGEKNLYNAHDATTRWNTILKDCISAIRNGYVISAKYMHVHRYLWTYTTLFIFDKSVQDKSMTWNVVQITTIKLLCPAQMSSNVIISKWRRTRTTTAHRHDALWNCKFAKPFVGWKCVCLELICM